MATLSNSRSPQHLRWVASLLLGLLLAGIAAPSRAQQPVAPTLRVGRPLQVVQPTFQGPFQVAARNRHVITVTLDAAGRLRARASWSGTGRLALILNGPDQTGYYAREDGTSPLTLTFTITDALLERGSQWTLSVVNFGASGPPIEGTLAVTLPRPAALPPPTSDDGRTPRIPRPDVIPDVIRALDRPQLLQDGSMRFTLPSGSIAHISPSDTLTVVDPASPDTVETRTFMYTHVQTIDPPVPPEALTANPDLTAWWMLMQKWMEGMNERMRLSLAQAFSEASMQSFNEAEASADLASPFERADYRLRFLERVLAALLTQTSEADTPPSNDE